MNPSGSGFHDTSLAFRPAEMEVMDLGRYSYADTLSIQRKIHRRRIQGKGTDALILVEHEPVYTLGKNAQEDHILQHYPEEVKIYKVERGGDVTYHGPGQLVLYPILDLHNYRTSITWYMRTLEEVVLRCLGSFGIQAVRKEGITGVWVEDEKIAALGVRISRWVTMHGLALNVSTPLHYYEGIIPCGLLEYGVTSMERVLEQLVDMHSVKAEIIRCFQECFTPTGGRSVP